MAAAPETAALDATLRAHAASYPLGVQLLETLQRQDTDLRAVLARAERYGDFFWRTLEAGVRDLLALFTTYANIVIPRDDVAYTIGQLRRLMGGFPHEDHFEAFDAVMHSFYEHPVYPAMEHFYYLGLHGVDRLRRVLELVEQVPGLDARPAGTVCDLGVGPGVVFTSLLERLPAWRGSAFDISSRCVAYARDVLALHGIGADRASVSVGDARRLRVPDASYDLLTATEIIEHVPDPDRLLVEIRRVLKPGGSLVASAPINLPWGPHLVVFENEAQVRSLFERAGFECQRFGSEPLGQSAQLTFGLFHQRSRF